MIGQLTAIMHSVLNLEIVKSLDKNNMRIYIIIIFKNLTTIEIGRSTFSQRS